MADQYQPDRGDIVYLDFTPNAGTEQGNRRPALVLSHRKFNIATGLVVVCPITNQIKGGGFEVPIPRGGSVTGTLLVNHLRSLDWIARHIAFHSKAPQGFVDDVVARFLTIIVDDTQDS